MGAYDKFHVTYDKFHNHFNHLDLEFLLEQLIRLWNKSYVTKICNMR